MAEKIRRIGDTPLSISVYSVEEAPTKINDRGILEIIFCLKGRVRFSYAYEEFTLHAGEYISVDRDAYYLYGDGNNLLVSFYFDLACYKSKYHFICNNLFVCEGLAETAMDYPREEHRRLKGMLIALLKFISENGSAEKVAGASERIVDMFVERFDIFFFHAGAGAGDKKGLAKLHEINDYLHSHMKEKVCIGDIAARFNFTEGYMSEYLRKMSVGFRGMMSYIRANESETYLLRTNKTILEISEECGFSDVKYYYSAFKRWYKCTPKQFREQYGKVSEEKIRYLDIIDTKDILEKLLTDHYMETYLFYSDGKIL